MQSYLKAFDLSEVVELLGDPQVQRYANLTLVQIKQHSEKVVKRYKALSCLQYAVSYSIFTRIINFDDSKQVWDILREEFQGKGGEFIIVISNMLFLNGLLFEEIFIEHLEGYEVKGIEATKKIIRYVKGTLDYGLKYLTQESSELQGYCDSDWAGSVDDSKIIGVNHAQWLRKVVIDMGFMQIKGTLHYMDNQ
ncbi:PREDICTED: uncharacterized protein LOC108662762 [Theobroma cacao]|uniref:Uncharacterized protein LOC108662762 n=1 Tax=Theobroma cacao TaxID=3641 RepID=A0AB32WLA9_THECC|nr:PREDICTED: uncharacterized protein LOC108662762 [Theobroma cacao]